MIKAMTIQREPIRRLDIAIAVVISALGLFLMYENVNDPEVGSSWLSLPVFLAVTVPVLWRRAAPVAAFAAVGGGLLAHIALFGSDVVRCGVVFPVVAVLVFAAAARLDRRDGLYALAAGLAIIGVMGAFDGAGAGVVTALWPLTLIVFGLGLVARSRGGMVSELQRRTGELHEARDERARLEVATDRARLSTELDALLQRRIGELARLADDGAATAGDPGAAAVALADIEDTSRQTLEEMRDLVGVLRHDDAPTAPQPTLVSLEALVLRAGGGDARLSVDGSPRVLPAGVELSAYRVVEHLLDGLGDAPGVEVGLRFGDQALEITVSGPAGRRGLAGMAVDRARERVLLHRGTLESRTRGGRAEAIAHLPLAIEA